MVINTRVQIVLVLLYLQYYLRDWDINILISGSGLMATPKLLHKKRVSIERDRGKRMYSPR